MTTAIGFGLALMAVGTVCFLTVPRQMLGIFPSDPLVIQIGEVGFWFAFPITELITSAVGAWWYREFLAKEYAYA